MAPAERVVVVTGAAGDLGAAISSTFAGMGWDTVMIDLHERALSDAAEAVGGRAFVADVTEPHGLAGVFHDIHDLVGDIDCLVNAAGLTRPGPSSELSDEDWRLVVDVNLSGAFFACRAAFPYLRRERASVVNISSISATRVMAGRAAYSASKAGLNALTSSLAVEWAPLGIRVNAVAPAWIDNGFLRALTARGVLDPQELVAKIPLGRLCTNDDAVAAVQFFAEAERSGFVTGQTLHVDGGYLHAG